MSKTRMFSTYERVGVLVVMTLVAAIGWLVIRDAQRLDLVHAQARTEENLRRLEELDAAVETCAKQCLLRGAEYSIYIEDRCLCSRTPLFDPLDD